jgi:hypothetical protein
VYPVLLAAIDTLVSFFSPHGTWGSFAYTQMDGLPVIQIASVLGTPAIIIPRRTVCLHRCGRALSRTERPWLAYGVPLVLIAIAEHGVEPDPKFASCGDPRLAQSLLLQLAPVEAFQIPVFAYCVHWAAGSDGIAQTVQQESRFM